MKATQSPLFLKLLADPVARACLQRWLTNRTVVVKDSAGNVYHPRTTPEGEK